MMLKKMMERFHCFSLFKKIGLFTNNEQDENNEQESDTKQIDEESEWAFMDTHDMEHRVSIFYDDFSHQYRIVDMNNKTIYPETYVTREDALDEIYHKSTRVIGLILHNGISIFK